MREPAVNMTALAALPEVALGLVAASMEAQGHTATALQGMALGVAETTLEPLVLCEAGMEPPDSSFSNTKVQHGRRC